MSSALRNTVLCLLLLAAAAHARAGSLSPKALAEAHAHGKVRVLVMLRDPAHDATAARAIGPQRRAAVAAKVDGVLSRLPAHAYGLRRRFSVVPAMAVEVDEAALLRLRDDPDVLRIDIDTPGGGHAVAPDEASVLNAVSPLQGLGFDGTGMKVAVIDTGVDTNHLDLQSRIVGQQCFCSSSSGVGGCCPNAQATQAGAGSAEDDNGHGTNVSGIMVGQGIAAPRGALPGAQLVAVKVLDRNNAFCCSSDVIAAMDWIASNHPDVDAVNLSLGTSALFPGDCDGAAAYTQAMATAVNALVARGALVSASAGNQGNSTATSAPACIAAAVNVGATWDFTGGSRTFLGCTETATAPKQPACFANRSATTDLYAAGAFVTAAGFDGTTSTYGGTSQASPMVAACAAALKQAAPASTVAQRVEAMRLAPTRVTDPVSGRSYPFLDCVDALRLVTPHAVALDFDGDGRSDVPWRNRNTGADTVWKSANAATVQATTAVTNLAWKIVGVGDFDGDRKADLLWRQDSSGANVIWRSGNSGTPQATATVNNLAWKVAGVGDFDGDGRDDILWRNSSSGADAIWKSGNASTTQAIANVVDLAWRVAGVGDFNADGRDDILWRHAISGSNAVWASGSSNTQQAIARVSDLAWQVAGVGDFDGDGKADILWRNGSTGGNTLWKAASATNQIGVAGVTNMVWKVAAIADYNGDGRADILWRHGINGSNAIWLSANIGTSQPTAALTDLAWEIKP